MIKMLVAYLGLDLDRDYLHNAFRKKKQQQKTSTPKTLRLDRVVELEPDVKT